MGDLTGSCGCDNGCGCNNSCGCGCNGSMGLFNFGGNNSCIWIILLLIFCRGNGGSCGIFGGNNCGCGCDNNNNCCNIIVWLIILSLFTGNCGC